MPSGKLCDCTPPGGVDLATWNGDAAHNWNRFHQDLERAWGQRLQYFRGVEVQGRGALHFHVLIRLQVGQVVKLGELRKLAIKHQFGHSLTCDPVRDGRGAGYAAKYVTKAAGAREGVPWVQRSTGEIKRRAGYRCWSSSRRWGLTMGQLVESQRSFAIARAASEGTGDGGSRLRVPATAPKAPLDSSPHSYTAGCRSGPALGVGAGV
jgi:hypothetical protein